MKEKRIKKKCKKQKNRKCGLRNKSKKKKRGLKKKRKKRKRKRILQFGSYIGDPVDGYRDYDENASYIDPDEDSYSYINPNNDDKDSYSYNDVYDKKFKLK